MWIHADGFPGEIAQSRPFSSLSLQIRSISPGTRVGSILTYSCSFTLVFTSFTYIRGFKLQPQYTNLTKYSFFYTKVDYTVLSLFNAFKRPRRETKTRQTWVPASQFLLWPHKGPFSQDFIIIKTSKRWTFQICRICCKKNRDKCSARCHQNLIVKRNGMKNLHYLCNMLAYCTVRQRSCWYLGKFSISWLLCPPVEKVCNKSMHNYSLPFTIIGSCHVEQRNSTSSSDISQPTAEFTNRGVLWCAR